MTNSQPKSPRPTAVVPRRSFRVEGAGAFRPGLRDGLRREPALSELFSLGAVTNIL